jgi:8-oxo-dGTP diphosphatase
MKQKFMLIPAVHLILLKDNEILLLRRYNTGYEDGNYSIVAGHLDGNETFIEAVIREAKEEAGVTVLPSNLEVVHVMHRKQLNEERIDFFIKADKWDKIPRIMEPDKADELVWCPLNKLPDNTIPYVRFALNNIMDSVYYSEFGWGKQ